MGALTSSSTVPGAMPSPRCSTSRSRARASPPSVRPQVHPARSRCGGSSGSSSRSWAPRWAPRTSSGRWSRCSTARGSTPSWIGCSAGRGVAGAHPHGRGRSVRQDRAAHRLTGPRHDGWDGVRAILASPALGSTCPLRIGCGHGIAGSQPRAGLRTAGGVRTGGSRPRRGSVGSVWLGSAGPDARYQRRRSPGPVCTGGEVIQSVSRAIRTP